MSSSVRKRRRNILMSCSSIKKETTVKMMTLLELDNLVKKHISSLKVPRWKQFEKVEVTINVENELFEIKSNSLKVSIGYMTRETERENIKKYGEKK